MTWPVAPLTTVKVRGHWVSPVTGANLAGTAKLSAVNAAISPDGDLLFTITPDRKALVDGAVEWPAVLLSDSPGLGQKVLYRVQVYGSDHIEDRFVEFLTSQVIGGVIRLENVVTVEPGPEVASYLLVSQLGAADGVAPLGADKKVPAANLPPSSGGGVATVTAGDATIVIGGTGTDPTVRVGSLPQAQVTGLVTALAGKEATGVAAGLVSTHEAAADPHSVYLTTTEGNALITAHESAPDPHPTYLTVAEANALYSVLAHKHHLDLILSAFGFKGITGHPASFGDSASPTQAAQLFVLVPVPPGELISTVKVANGAAATYSATGVTARFKCYTFDGALLGSTPDDPTLWTAPGWRSGNISVPFNAPSNGLMFLGMSFGGHTNASPAVMTGTMNSAVLSGLIGGKRLAIFDSGPADLPDTINPATLGLATDWYPLAGVL